MRKKLLLVLALGLLALLPACAVGRSSTSSSVSVGLGGGGDLYITIWTRRTDYYLGEQVEVSLSLENRTDQEVVLEQLDRPAVDLVISGGDYQDVELRWSEGPGAGEDLTRVVLQPRETLNLDWTLPSLEKGDYRVDGVWWLFGREATVYIGITYYMIN